MPASTEPFPPVPAELTAQQPISGTRLWSQAVLAGVTGWSLGGESAVEVLVKAHVQTESLLEATTEVPWLYGLAA